MTRIQIANVVLEGNVIHMNLFMIEQSSIRQVHSHARHKGLVGRKKKGIDSLARLPEKKKTSLKNSYK